MYDSILRTFGEGESVDVTLKDGTRFEGITITTREDHDASDQYQVSRTELRFDALDVTQLRRVPDDYTSPLQLTEHSTRGGGEWREPPKAEAVDDTDPADMTFEDFGVVATIELVE
jgi:hypothetical protein